MLYPILKALPRNHLSYLIGKLLHVRLPAPLARISVRVFCSLYGIDTSTAARSVEEYPSIGDFFVRDLKAGVRPIEADVVSPVDGKLRASGSIASGTLIQVKGIEYSLADFLRNQELSQRYHGGYFFNFYLAPPDYHHIHSPVTGEVIECGHIPGTLWPVNDWSLNNIPSLFAINERVAVVIRTANYGLVTVVMVGATNVGKISLTFDSLVTNANPFKKSPSEPEYKSQNVKISAGDRIGTFHMGSSVVVLFEKMPGALPEDIVPGARVLYGKRLKLD